MYTHGELDISVANTDEWDRAFELAGELGLLLKSKTVYGSWLRKGRFRQLTPENVTVLDAGIGPEGERFLFELNGSHKEFEPTRGRQPNGSIKLEFVSDARI
jgi:hypothetical protein